MCSWEFISDVANHHHSRDRSSPQHSPNISHAPLPLERESPAVRIQEDFGTSPGTNPGLHHLLPSLGVTAGSSRDGLYGRSYPGSNISNSECDDLSWPNPSDAHPLDTPDQTPSTSEAADNGLAHFSSSLPGNEAGEAVHSLMTPRPSLLAGNAANPAYEQNKAPTQPLSNRSHEPSPLGRYYLSTSDPQHISKRPQGSISFPGVSASNTPMPSMIPGYNTSPALRNTGEKDSPTLSMASDDALMLGDTITSDGKEMRLFPGMPAAGGNRRLGHSRLGSTAATIQPHQIPLPPSPHISGASNPSPNAAKDSPGVRAIALGFGGTGGQLGSGRVPPSPSSQAGDKGEGWTKSRPRLRQETADSFASTSSEEEDISSPMVLPDTSLRASDRGGSSPRSGFSSAMERGTMLDKSTKGLFPVWSDVQRFDRMANNPFAFGAGSTTYPSIPVSNAQFTFRAGTDAPTFPPMSPSSSSSFDSDDEANNRGPGNVRFSGPVSPKRSTRFVDPSDQSTAAEDGGDYGHGYGGGKGYTTSETRDGNRSGSITVGGKGYGDGSTSTGIATPRRGAEEDSSDDEDKPRSGRHTDKKLENPAASRLQRAYRLDGKERSSDNNLGNSHEAGNGASRLADTVSEDEGNRTATTFQETTDSEAETGSEYEGQSDGPRQRPRKRKAIRGDATGGGPDSKSETSSSSRPDFMPSKAKRRKAGPAEEGDVHCDYVEPLPVSPMHGQ